MSEEDYALEGEQQVPEIPAPELPYLPSMPKGKQPGVGLIGCGGITQYHLEAYQRCGIPVLAFCDVNEEAARARQQAFAPEAAVYRDYRELLRRDDIHVVDVATHPVVRAPILKDAIAAGKNVLSQKPFVTDLDTGLQLVEAARDRGLHLAVNQNGRWAPHFSYMRLAIEAGLIGEVTSVDMAVHWDHNWVNGTVFNDIPHVLLYDFSLHWFDILGCFMQGKKAAGVYSTVKSGPGQDARPPLLGSVVVEYPKALATMVFDGTTRHGARDRTTITGTKGTLHSEGPNLNSQSVSLHTSEGIARPKLTGTWFTSGFEGTMGELLCAIEEERKPFNGAEANLDSLALTFAAMASAEAGQPIKPGSIRSVEAQWLSYGA
jgi:predicted dehydrogenase